VNPLTYVRGAIVAASIALTIFIVWVVLGWRDAAGQLDTLRHQLQDERAARAREIDLASKASENYQHELEALRAAHVQLPPVRLCRQAVPAAPTVLTAGRTDDAPAAAGVGFTGSTGGDQPGTDIGPDLDSLAARCDAVTAQLRGLQGWAASAGVAD